MGRASRWEKAVWVIQYGMEYASTMTEDLPFKDVDDAVAYLKEFTGLDHGRDHEAWANALKTIDTDAIIKKRLAEHRKPRNEERRCFFEARMNAKKQTGD